jgi:hypothetical protein
MNQKLAPQAASWVAVTGSIERPEVVMAGGTAGRNLEIVGRVIDAAPQSLVWGRASSRVLSDPGADRRSAS